MAAKTPRPKDLQTQIATLDANWKRALADYQNLLRRVEQDKKQFTKIAGVNLIARLLPSLDLIELAASHSDDMGVQMSAKQFHGALVEEGLEIISPSSGDKFDPALHDCSEIVTPAAPDQADTIAETVLKGYKIGDYILRPAKVKVYKHV